MQINDFFSVKSEESDIMSFAALKINLYDNAASHCQICRNWKEVFLQHAIYMEYELFYDILLQVCDVHCMSQNMRGNYRPRNLK